MKTKSNAIQRGVPKVHGRSKNRDPKGGSMQKRRVEIGMTRKEMSKRYRIPVSRVTNTEYKCGSNEFFGREWNDGFTAADNAVVAALKDAESKTKAVSPALAPPADAEDQRDVDDAVNAIVTVTSDQWHLKSLQQALPEGSQITIILPTGLRLRLL